MRVVTVRESGHIDSLNIFPRGNIVLFRFHRIIGHASFILWFRFMSLSGTSRLLDRFMGCGRYHPSPHITDSNWTVLCAIFVLWDESNIFRGYCVVFVFSRTSGTGVPFGSFQNFVFMDFSQLHGCIDAIYGCAGSCVRYKYNCDFIYLWARWWPSFRHYL